jgi:polysaccharide pyruvyl transferase WcaK-like protein
MINLFCIRPKGFNVGNDAIYLGLRHFIHETFGEAVNLINLPATAKYDGNGKAGLTPKTIYEINQYGHGVIVGGGNLFENGELDVCLDALPTLEVPMMIFSVSRGRIYNRQHQLVDRTDALPDRVLKALHEKSSCGLYRDQATVDYLRSIGCESVRLGGCPTIFLDRVAAGLPTVPGEYENSVLISVRTPTLMSIPLERQSQVYSDVVGLVRLLRDEGYPDVRLLCHDHRDLQFAASIPNVEYVYTSDVYRYLAILKQCRLNVTYRLHSFLPCQAFECPAIKISYDQRAISLMETVGFGQWNINMLQGPSVVEQVADRLDRIEQLAAIRQQLRPHWNQIYNEMKSTFRQFSTEIHEFKSRLEGPNVTEPCLAKIA